MNRYPSAWRLLLPAFAFLVFGCGGDDSTSPPDPAPIPLVSGVIDGGGGELTHEDVVLTVPGGALDESTRLAIYAEDGEHPFGDPAAPVVRIHGLPAELGAPVTLRLRHGLAAADGDTLLAFLGEEREAYSGGGGQSWEIAAARDSAGWAVLELERGALELGTKVLGDLEATVTRTLRVMDGGDDRFEVVFDPALVAPDEAAAVVSDFDRAYQTLVQWDFAFGDGSIWPLVVYAREPAASIACYVAAPHGRGHFDFDPDLLQPGVRRFPVVVHELFHCAQTFYDPRDPAGWGVLNRERLWLDEATAAYLEATVNTTDGAYPLGLSDDNYAAPIAGIAGDPDLTESDYGYGMSQFITYLVDNGCPALGEDAIPALFVHFREHGDVTDAIDAVAVPPVASWCLDLHRAWARNAIFPAFEVNWFWYEWSIDDYLAAPVGSTASARLTVNDLGSDVAKFFLEGDGAETGSKLVIEAHRLDFDGPAEELPLTVYGRTPQDDLALVATGVDQLLLDDWPSLRASCSDLLVMVSRPYTTAAGHTGSRRIEVRATVRPDLSHLDATAFTGAAIEVQTSVRFGGAIEPEVLDNYQVSIMSPVGWNGHALAIAVPGDTVSIEIDPATLVLGDWYAHRQYDDPRYAVYRLGGHGIPLDSWDENGVVYRLQGAPSCDALSDVFWSYGPDADSDPVGWIESFSCIDAANWTYGSWIYIHLYRSPTTTREDRAETCPTSCSPRARPNAASSATAP